MPDPDGRSERVASLLADRYELLELLGQGGFAAVYRVRNLRLRRVEALKVLSANLTDDESFARRFEQEARVAASLDHPNIVKIYDYGVHEDLFWFSMQFIDGPTLRRQLKEIGRLTPERAARIGAALLDALEYSHARGVIHRDIKPDNVLLDPAGRPYLTDFGIAKSRDSLVQTHAGFVLGSPAYMSPEQIKGEPLDPRTDIYSVGVTLYVMLSGSLPFTAEDTFRAAMKKLSEPPPPLSQKVAGIPSGLESVVMRALAREPGDRFAGAREMGEALESFVHATPAPAPAVHVYESDTRAAMPAPEVGREDLDKTTPLPRPAPLPAPPPVAPTPSGAGRSRLLLGSLLLVLTAAVLLLLQVSRGPSAAIENAPPNVAPLGRLPRPSPETQPTSPRGPFFAGPPPLATTVAAPAPAPTTAMAAPEAPPARETEVPLAAPTAAVSAPTRAPVRPRATRPAAIATPGVPAATTGAPEQLPPGAARPRVAKFPPEQDPSYPIRIPEELVRAYRNGSVGLLVTVGEDGTVKSARVISELCPECDRAALEAVKSSRFRPARDAEGRPVEGTFAFSVRF